MTVLGFDRRDGAMLVNLFRMTLNDRFLGSGLGLYWAVLSPLLLMGIYTFVFSYVFPGRLPGREGTLPFVIWLISGYGPWLALSEGLGSATGSVVGNAGVVKNIAFKSEVLPIVGALIGLVPLLVTLVVILILKLIGGDVPGAAWLFLPVAAGLLLLFVSGLGLFLGALQVFVRDTALVLPSVLTMLLFASPIFYPLSSYPEAAQPILAFNPFYVMAELFRAPLLDDRMPPLWMPPYLAAVGAVLFVGGLAWFRRLKSFFDSRL